MINKITLKYKYIKGNAKNHTNLLIKIRSAKLKHWSKMAFYTENINECKWMFKLGYYLMSCLRLIIYLVKNFEFIKC